ncbi:MAG: 3',5'-cyclic-nucleotide phosphodiesterase [Lutibacter sp.]|nr:3',5'-cyclic-nucleotide phosphodiesterase [Lutibacter sp.]MDP3944900.1 3',5'-cyclic-nucleotide phosphodiesterase [Lutibacter sp.]
MKYFIFYLSQFLLLISCKSISPEATFKVNPLGVKGGLDESNLSAYMVAPINSENYICLDAGTIYAGLSKSVSTGIFKEKPEYILKNNIKAYLISHAHLDHVAGLVINSPADVPKTIYASQYVIDVFTEKYFTWQNWANFTNLGEEPRLNTYDFEILEPHKEIAITNTELFVTPFTLSHSNPYQSQAFLVRYKNNYLLYLGDTGSDKIENSEKLLQLWKSIAPLIISNQLKAIFIEVSFPNSQSNSSLFGHLKPQLFYDEMGVLESYTGKNTLNNFPIVITHRKPHENNETIIKEELLKANSLKLKLVFPEQGKLIKF